MYVSGRDEDNASQCRHLMPALAPADMLVHRKGTQYRGMYESYNTLLRCVSIIVHLAALQVRFACYENLLVHMSSAEIRNSSLMDHASLQTVLYCTGVRQRQGRYPDSREMFMRDTT